MANIGFYEREEDIMKSWNKPLLKTLLYSELSTQIKISACSDFTPRKIGSY